MKINISPYYEVLSKRAAEAVMKQVRAKPDSVLVFPGGDTPLGMFRELVEAVEQGKLDVSNCTFMSLDEWVGLGGGDEGSCLNTLNRHFFQPARISPKQIDFFDAQAADLPSVCSRFDERIAALGGIDLAVVGVGLNGHIGFNEPGTAWDTLCHIVPLDQVTKSVAVKYFPDGTDHVHQGITLGMKHLLDSKHVIVLANGAKKHDIVHKALNEPASIDTPVSALKQHPNCSLMVDVACWNGA